MKSFAELQYCCEFELQLRYYVHVYPFEWYEFSYSPSSYTTFFLQGRCQH